MVRLFSKGLILILLNFLQLKCSFTGIKRAVVNSVYKKCAEVSNNYIKHNLIQWQIGGPNVIVIIDTYPEGCKKFKSFEAEYNRNSLSILCLAEAKEIPPRYWFHILDKNIKNKEEQENIALQTIYQIVKPGSILITNLDSKVCSYESLQCLKHIYPVIISTDGLQRHDNEYQKIFVNLETIWKPALNICDYAHGNIVSEVQNFLTHELWVQNFGSQSFEILLNQMCSFEI